MPKRIVITSLLLFRHYCSICAKPLCFV